MKLCINEELTYAEKRIRMELIEISYGFLDPSWKIENLRAAFTRVYVPLEGEGILYFGDRTVHLRPGKIYVVPSQLNFSCSCPEYLNKIYVHLTLTRPDGEDVFAGLDTCLILENCEARAAEMEALYNGNDLRSALRLKLLLYGILDDALAQTPCQNLPIRSYSEYTKDALAYIDSHLSAGLTIGEISSALFISKLVLQKNFKADIHKSIGAYIDDCLMKSAEQELLNRNLSIKEISDRLGFCDQFYFSRRFSEFHGISPKKFRQMHGV
ncbi:MAG: helix-turn-helix transcriptional regulator [Clostridia bacterium]|nr:helix-turn-helix transcriptional regulator [Clostridia bacterium]